MRWSRNLIVLAFREEYTLLAEESGVVYELCAIDRGRPIIKLLPNEEVILGGHSASSFVFCLLLLFFWLWFSTSLDVHI